MPDYEKLYHIMFNAASDALRELEDLNVGRASRLLVDAQSKAGEIYISQGEDGKEE